MTKRQIFFFYEEVGWFIIFLANTVASARLYVADVPPHHATLLQLSLFFGLVYLPWQTLHVHSIVTRAATAPLQPVVSVACNLRSALFDYHVTTEGEKWGGVIGVMWMAAYWALLVPPWLYYTTVTLV
eukprot:CAMPEP_0175925544 /NCGR_PEP_ID=MMETSP0108-20121206/15702_1 /TAXON_ID=195067 ORGANISM="Goniomonas pacifica, Strain CCMP1869" /NCGR_SAMPLE_ID=MMETSP0108 /ASSEMBLY_ACC=CAM_ASM_000204 /LENGTH=127 /DNA_ID=CAMNT_0017248701 /DNA_START=516 /DNA_END=899 /DNA_ORIENTATION=-